jgi:hypothetical protein
MIPVRTGWGNAGSMPRLGLLLAILGGFVAVTAAEAADDMDYSVTLTGACQYQILMGWDDCQNRAIFTQFKGGKYRFNFIDKNKNIFVFSGKKERQIDNSNLYSNIDTMQTTIDGKTTVDAQAMGGCTTKITPAGDKFVYIDCAITNSKNVLFKFRINNITDVERTIAAQ